MADRVPCRERDAIFGVDDRADLGPRRGAVTFDDVRHDEDPALGAHSDGQVGAEEQPSVLDAADHRVDHGERRPRRLEGRAVRRLVGPGRRDGMHAGDVEEHRRAPVAEVFDVQHTARARGRTLRVRHDRVGLGEAGGDGEGGVGLWHEPTLDGGRGG